MTKYFLSESLRRFVRLSTLLTLFCFVAACSTTSSNVRDVSAGTDLRSAENTRLAIIGEGMRTSFQNSGRLYKLHSDANTIVAIARIVARHYGFTVVEPQQAEYIIEIHSALPDGGACVSGVEAAELDASYTISILTLGAFPATAVHCLVVDASLYSNFGGEKELMGEFESNTGSVELVAGVNDLKVYQRAVKPEDERLGLEASIGGLLSELIEEGAFQ